MVLQNDPGQFSINESPEEESPNTYLASVRVLFVVSFSDHAIWKNSLGPAPIHTWES